MIAHYDLCDYTRFWEGREYEDQAEKIALDKLLVQVTNRDSFVDVGGGYGRLTAYLAKQFKHGLLIDPSARNIQTAKGFLKDLDTVEMKVGSLPRLELKDNYFDLVTMIRVSHHLVDIAPTIKELTRIVKPNGYIIIEVANKINLMARCKAYLRADFGFSRSLEIKDRSSEESKREKRIAFVNHHPQEVLKLLGDNGLSIINILSVSNLRSGIFKKVVPLALLLRIEKILQSPLANIFGGPSIFILAQKHHKN